MLRMAILFFIVAIIAAVFGFGESPPSPRGSRGSCWLCS
ncbi:unnamed protein product [Gemmata massiliana]|uniref:Uncharacterized protein n=1 Tax=Gemmata massiliana TaxID=1210884 RepID=A0A6P2CYG3_9BACT|nr:unnamed protein product [Gemmata massiliana]